MLTVAYEFAASSYKTMELLKAITEKYEERFSDEEIWEITCEVLILRKQYSDHPEIGDRVKFNHWDTGVEYIGTVIIAEILPESDNLCVCVDTGKTGRFYPSSDSVRFA